jgi:demethylmenaquinone methyltransferase/2-methoxy-6-polyprenyl-1,4-benzoquinol methylase
LLAQAGVGVGHRVLDVATGTGEAAIFAASRVGGSGRVVRIDVSRPMLAVAAAKIAERPIVLLQMDAQAVAFKDASFDAASPSILESLCGAPWSATCEDVR